MDQVLGLLVDADESAGQLPAVIVAVDPPEHLNGAQWIHPLNMMRSGMRTGDALLQRVLAGAKPAAELIGADADAERWADVARAAGLEVLVYRDRNSRVWIAPARLGDRVDRGALTAAWHAIAAADPVHARADRLLDVIDRGLATAFDLDLPQQPVQRGSMLQPAWWDEHSGEGFVVLGAVLGYPPASTYARLLGF